MSMTKHILIDPELLKFIDDNREYNRETPNDILKRKLNLLIKIKKR